MKDKGILGKKEKGMKKDKIAGEGGGKGGVQVGGDGWIHLYLFSLGLGSRMPGSKGAFVKPLPPASGQDSNLLISSLGNP